MKRVLICFLVMAAQAVFAQNSDALNDGVNFGNSIAPTSNRQVVNPGAVNSNAWAGNASTPMSVPKGLGGFSTPKTDVSVYNAATTGGLTSLGNKAQNDCQDFTPGNDPLRNQECAAVNFLSNKCITPSSGQASILGSLGNSQTAQSAACDGTYGQGSQKFNFKDQLTESDPLFDPIRDLKTKAASVMGQVCTEKTVITEPAQFDTNICVKSSTTDLVSCSQYLNMTITTSKEAATVTNSCNDGTLVGSFCQKTSTGEGTPFYACEAGYTLSGSSCKKTVSTSAKPNYYCPSGSTLSGSNCISSNNVSTPALIASYSCPAGATLSGANCQTTTTIAATVASYACPVGESRSGTTCFKTTTTTNTASTNYSCPPGSTLSGSNCIGTATSAATQVKGCPAGYNGSWSNGTLAWCTKTISLTATTSSTCPFDGSCYFNGGGDPIQTLQTCSWAASQGYATAYDGGSDTCIATPMTKYSCQAGQVLSGTNCISTATTSTIILGYTCPAGSALSGSSCVTTSSTTATVSYNCPAGQALYGSTCTQTTTTTSAATPVYGCSAGYTLSGSSCKITTSVSATPNYSCPAGSKLSGSNCMSATNVTTAANITSYSCPAGTILSGSNCLTTSTVAASIAGYTCPIGATLSGSSCITVVTTPAIINYSCVDGSAPVAGICIYKAAQTSWTNTCGSLESSAGTALGAPK